MAIVATLALCFSFAPRPALADQAAVNRNIILGAAAVAAGIIINNNIQHKRAQANRVVGYTRDGGTVYADGRVVYPNGDTLYTGNRNGQACSYTGYGTQCGADPVAYYPRGYNGHDHGHHYGDDKHGRFRGDHRHHGEHGDHGDGDDGDDGGDR